MFCDSDSDAKDAVAKLYARLSSTLNHLDVVARTGYRAVIVPQVHVKSVVLLYFKCMFSLVHCTRVECKCTGFAEC